jgi:ESS family glutamate:Na+ symporter
VLFLGLFGSNLFPTFGFLVPLAFNEGPGQALSMGKAWESVGFANGATIGLTLAMMGYFFSFFVGVPLVNRGIRKGLAALSPGKPSREFLAGYFQEADIKESAGRLTIHSGNAETLAFQAALVGCVYGLTYLPVELLGRVVPDDVSKMLWGFFFIFGLIVALAVKGIMSRLGIRYLADPGVQRRITGWSVDYMVTAMVAAIQVKIVWEYILPISLAGLAAGVSTTLLVVHLGRRLPAYSLERTAAIYGVVTGTVASGLLLLRMLDPEFKTPAAYELAVMNLFALPVVGICTVLTNGPIWWHWPLWSTMLVFAAIGAVSLTLMKLLGYSNTPT